MSEREEMGREGKGGLESVCALPFPLLFSNDPTQIQTEAVRPLTLHTLTPLTVTHTHSTCDYTTAYPNTEVTNQQVSYPIEQ